MKRRWFRDSNLLSTQRAAKRAWNEEERQNLLAILREEWFIWGD